MVFGLVGDSRLLVPHSASLRGVERGRDHSPLVVIYELSAIGARLEICTRLLEGCGLRILVTAVKDPPRARVDDRAMEEGLDTRRSVNIAIH